MTWHARVYTISDTSKLIVDETGRPIYSIKDLRPYMTDVIEKIHYKHRDIYRLQKLNKTVPAVDNEAVQTWGGKKIIDVLMHNDTATILKSGYDITTGQRLFNPVNYDDQNMIKNEIAVRKARIKKEKNILEAVMPYIAILGGFLFVIAVVYMNVELNTSMNDHEYKMKQEFADTDVEIAKINREAMAEYAKIMQDISRENQASLYNLTRTMTEFQAELDEKIAELEESNK
jgi:hypothetical protein